MNKFFYTYNLKNDFINELSFCLTENPIHDSGNKRNYIKQTPLNRLVNFRFFNNIDEIFLNMKWRNMLYVMKVI